MALPRPRDTLSFANTQIEMSFEKGPKPIETSNFFFKNQVVLRILDYVIMILLKMKQLYVNNFFIQNNLKVDE